MHNDGLKVLENDNFEFKSFVAWSSHSLIRKVSGLNLEVKYAFEKFEIDQKESR